MTSWQIDLAPKFMSQSLRKWKFVQQTDRQTNKQTNKQTDKQTKLERFCGRKLFQPIFQSRHFPTPLFKFFQRLRFHKNVSYLYIVWPKETQHNVIQHNNKNVTHNIKAFGSQCRIFYCYTECCYITWPWPTPTDINKYTAAVLVNLSTCPLFYSDT
jgi:hypothetical protein